MTTFQEPTHKFAPFAGNQEIFGHGCASEAELRGYCRILGAELRVIPVNDMDRQLDFNFVIPAPAPVE